MGTFFGRWSFSISRLRVVFLAYLVGQNGEAPESVDILLDGWSQNGDPALDTQPRQMEVKTAGLGLAKHAGPRTQTAPRENGFQRLQRLRTSEPAQGGGGRLGGLVLQPHAQLPGGPRLWNEALNNTEQSIS